MPEGDTIHRTAAALQRAIGGKRLTGFRSTLPALSRARLAGRTVERIEARGKHLWIRFDDGRALRSHMRMAGSWHLYRPGERWWKPEHLARAVLETDEFLAVCFQAPVLELVAPGRIEAHPALAGLGPDLLAPVFDSAEAVRRLRAAPDRSIAEALLAQSDVSGIGNIYKSESLFLCRLHPSRAVASLSDDSIRRLLTTARRLMSASVVGAGRGTRRASEGPRYWVYRRSGRACLRCGGMVRMSRHGADRRSTYWCPGCQPP